MGRRDAFCDSFRHFQSELESRWIPGVHPLAYIPWRTSLGLLPWKMLRRGDMLWWPGSITKTPLLLLGEANRAVWVLAVRR